jgi:CubicO group peptidase (beta-lactamase class C family)
VKNSSRAPDELEKLAVETLKEHTPAGPCTRTPVFRIGSISKTMTAIAVMQLVEERRLGLDDTIGEHLRSSRIPLTFERAADGRVEALHAASALGGFPRLRLWSRVAGGTTACAAAAAAVRRRRRRRAPLDALRRR